MTHAINAVDEMRARVTAAAIQGKRATPKKKIWEAPSLDQFADGQVLAFDQTFTNTGWCRFNMIDGVLTIIAKGTITEKKTPDLTSHKDTIQRAVYMKARIKAVLTEWGGDSVSVVAEHPALGGFRTESSLLGLMGVWLAVEEVTNRARPDGVVTNDHMKKVLCSPEARSDKRHITQALSRYTEVGHGWNEHNRDALALGLTFLYDRKPST